MMKLIRIIAVFLVLVGLSLSGVSQAAKVRGWAGGGPGPTVSYADSGGISDTSLLFSISPSGAFIFWEHFLVGLRLDSFFDLDETTDLVSTLSPMVGVAFRFDPVQFYFASMIGLNMPVEVDLDSDTESDVGFLVGGVAGIDFFLAKQFSIGAEFGTQAVFQDPDPIRFIGAATFKWQFEFGS